LTDQPTSGYYRCRVNLLHSQGPVVSAHIATVVVVAGTGSNKRHINEPKFIDVRLADTIGDVEQ